MPNVRPRCIQLGCSTVGSSYTCSIRTCSKMCPVHYYVQIRGPSRYRTARSDPWWYFQVHDHDNCKLGCQCLREDCNNAGATLSIQGITCRFKGSHVGSGDHILGACVTSRYALKNIASGVPMHSTALLYPMHSTALRYPIHEAVLLSWILARFAARGTMRHRT